jgi:CubicO group peptidase (beta-lactamase class C family)
MEVQPPRRILKRPRPAQVVLAVFLEELANPVRPLRRGLGRGQPSLHFRAKIVEGLHSIRLKSSFAEKPQMLAQRKHANMGGVPQFFPAILIFRALRMLARMDVLDQDRSANPANVTESISGVYPLGFRVKNWIFCIVSLFALAGCGTQESKPFPNAPSIKRLDGSTLTAAEIDATVTRLMATAKVTGTGLAILNDGKIVYLKTYGFRDRKKALQLAPDSVMSAASFSKVAFAYMVMQLVQEGVLDLDKPVYQYLPKPLPEYGDYRDLAGDDRYKKITSRMLLDHTAGFPNWRWFEDDHKLHIHFDPGSRFAYSGEGIMLLQLVIETVTHKPLEDLMQARVFQPLGMTRTSMVSHLRFESNSANGYDEQESSLGPQRRLQAQAAGSMKTTPADFARFMQAVLQSQGLREETKDLMLGPQIAILSKHEFPTLSAETTDENKSIRLSYGLAWGLYWTPYGKAFFKEGHDEGWRNYTVCFDDAKIGIVIMTNSSNGESIYKELLETLLKNTYTPIEWEGFTPYNSPH